MVHGSRMRLSVTLTEQQWRFLRQEARRLNISVGEVLRRLIDLVRLPEDSADSDSR